jgi:hypothetical protein
MARIGIQYQREQLIFLDESAKDDRTISRRYGYSEINTRAIKKVAFIRGKRYTLFTSTFLRWYYCCGYHGGWLYEGKI